MFLRVRSFDMDRTLGGNWRCRYKKENQAASQDDSYAISRHPAILVDSARSGERQSRERKTMAGKVSFSVCSSATSLGEAEFTENPVSRNFSPHS